jgi:uncharacterized protein (DUF697 family)/uncharacterized tellurite resistance protein B-like protein
MSATQEESLASLRLLVSVAKADGLLHDREKESLQAALADYEAVEGGLDEDLALGLLLGETTDLDASLGAISSDEARAHAYGAAFAIAHADGDCSAEEAALLEKIREAFGISQERQQYLERVFSPREPAVTKATDASAPMFEGVERRHKVQEETRKTAVICAVLGAFPFPLLAIATDLAVVGLQVALAKDIAGFYGQQMDTDKIKGMLAGFGVGTGAWIAATNLLKFFPGWGSAAGAGMAYASTYAIGRVLTEHFEEGELDPSTLKERFAAAKKEGKKAYKEDKEQIEAKSEAAKDKLAELGKQLEAGKITQAEFEERAADLG